MDIRNSKKYIALFISLYCKKGSKFLPKWTPHEQRTHLLRMFQVMYEIAFLLSGPSTKAHHFYEI